MKIFKYCIVVISVLETYCSTVINMHKSTHGKRMNEDKTRWRPPSILIIPLILCGCVIFFVQLYQLRYFKIPATIPLRQPSLSISEEMNLKGFLIKTKGCRIPDMDPFDLSVKKYIFQEKTVICNNGTPPLIESNLTSLYVLKKSLPAYGINDYNLLKCCYSVFKRAIPKEYVWGHKVIFNRKCVAFNQSCVIRDEFVRVICLYNGRQIYKDFFSFVPIKPQLKKKSSRNAPLNVLIVGLDGVSRLNLHRQMPKTVQILKDLNGIELMGYNKVGDNTFPNLIPVLTGLTEDELAKTCLETKRSRFDKCPFVWKNYRSKGFSTVFGEDSARMGIFNYFKWGFLKPPTDYFWGPYNFEMEQQIGNQFKLNIMQCVGARLVYNTLLEYINKFVQTMHMNEIPFFGFFWGASLSHDYLNKPKLGDTDYVKFLSNLNTSKIFDDTVLIFLSDHGIRWGGIRTTYQGMMEERLPFLFILLPQKYRDTYYHSYINLKKNIRRLTTPFDLHEMLKDLLDPNDLTREALISRVQQRNGIQRGYSLFEPIPPSRTCEQAGIASHWCTCQESTDINKYEIVVIEAVDFTIGRINEKLVGYADCAYLSLSEIVNARQHSGNSVLVQSNIYFRDYTIVFRTIPGDAVFEATVRQHFVYKSDVYHFNITGTISRINLYGTQSLCMTDFHLKLYCYCKT